MSAIRSACAAAMCVTSLLASTGAVAQQDALNKIFTADMLKADRAYLEQFTGPARNTYESAAGTRRVYKLGECEVGAYFDENVVLALRLDLTPQCSFDLNRFVRPREGRFPPANAMKFGDFDTAMNGGGQYHADCLFLCGNAAESVVFQDWTGVQADNWLVVRLEVPLREDPAIDAGFAWREAMAGEDEDWRIDARFNCTDRYDARAHDAFRNVQVSAITVGYFLPELTTCPDSAS